MAITLLASGGLGNQLFQYAAARAASIDRNVELKINLRFFRDKGINAKSFWLHHFPIAASIESSELPILGSHSLIHRAFRKMVTEPARLRYVEPGLGFDSRFLDIKDGTVMSGLFQSPLYFEGKDDLLRKEIDILEVSGAPSQFQCRPISEYIGIHLRRGDYLNHAGFLLPNFLEYYRAAIDAAQLDNPNCPLLVFSDDIAWCTTLEILRGATFFQGNDSRPTRPYIDMMCMSQCRAIIISNSSYSWWAGWLAKRTNAKVYAPFLWINSTPVEKIRILPKEWVEVRWNIQS